MTKKTIITTLGVCVSIGSLLPLPQAVLNILFFILGLAIIFFTRIKF
jgi:hypothetical protein